MAQSQKIHYGTVVVVVGFFGGKKAESNITKPDFDYKILPNC